MTNYELISTYIYIISAVIALLMLGIGLYQITQLIQQVKASVESNTINRLTALLALEDTIGERRLRLSEAGIELAEMRKKSKTNPTVYNDSFDISKLKFDEAKQMYLNALDRLCFCLNRGVLSEEELRSEYRDVINRAVVDFADDFKTATPYRNVKKVFEKWADS